MRLFFDVVPSRAQPASCMFGAVFFPSYFALCTTAALSLALLSSQAGWFLELVPLFVHCCSGFWYLRSFRRWYRPYEPSITGKFPHILFQRCDPYVSAWLLLESVPGVPSMRVAQARSCQRLDEPPQSPWRNPCHWPEPRRFSLLRRAACSLAFTTVNSAISSSVCFLDHFAQASR